MNYTGEWRPPTDGITPWSHVDEDDPTCLARCIIDTVRDIEQRQTSIFEGNRRHARIYAGYLPNGMTWTAGPGTNVRAPFEATKAVVRSICDTATALIVRSRPKATIVTDGADWGVQKQARDLDQFLVGAYERSQIYSVSPRAFHDSTVFGTGGWKYVTRGTGEDWHVACERFLPDDLVVDEDECHDGLTPQNMYHRVLVSPDALIRKYCSGDSEDDVAMRRKIRAATAVSSWPNRSIPRGKMILVDATYVDPDGGPGRRVLCFEGGVLSDKAWAPPWHPYTILHWAQPLSGFYGDGIPYRQYGRQSRITYTYRWIQRCHDLFATPKAWVDPMGGPPTLQMSNEIGAVIMSRRPPVFQTQAVCPPEVYNWLNQLEAGGFEDEGISQTMAQNQLPTGIESAPAQREVSFKEGQRFAPVSQRWEHAVAVEAAEKMAALYAERAASTKRPPRSRWVEHNLLYEIEWPDLERRQYMIRAAASSLESLSPASRIQAALELQQTNLLRNGEARALMGHPDLIRSDQLDNAPTAYAEMVLKRLLDGEFVEVDDYCDFSILDKVIRAGRLLAVTQNAPVALVDGCSEFLDRLDAATQAAAMAAQASAMAQQMGAAPSPGGFGVPGTPTTASQQGMPLPFSAGPG